jgi:hypothetical protein
MPWVTALMESSLSLSFSKCLDTELLENVIGKCSDRELFLSMSFSNCFCQRTLLRTFSKRVSQLIFHPMYGATSAF